MPCAELSTVLIWLVSSRLATKALVYVQVAMRRTLLLASVCFNASRGQDDMHWTDRYCTLIMGPGGENISVTEGRVLQQTWRPA